MSKYSAWSKEPFIKKNFKTTYITNYMEDTMTKKYKPKKVKEFNHIDATSVLSACGLPDTPEEKEHITSLMEAVRENITNTNVRSVLVENLETTLKGVDPRRAAFVLLHTISGVQQATEMKTLFGRIKTLIAKIALFFNKNNRYKGIGK